MATTSKIRVQRVRVGGAIKYFIVPLSTTYETRQPPTASQISSLLDALPAGYTYTVVGPATGGGSSTDGFAAYSYQDNRLDYNNKPVVSSPGLALVSRQITTKPRGPKGNNYAFAPQTAHNVALHRRLPKWTNHPSKIIIYPGGLYNDMSDNDIIGRGWTHTSEGALWQFGTEYPRQFKRAIESAFYDPARWAADDLPHGDPDKQKLYDWANEPHRLLDSDRAARLYAKKWVNVFEQFDWFGAGVDYFSVNHEIFDTSPGVNTNWPHHSGLMTRAIIEEMESRMVNGVRKFPIAKSGLSDYGGLVSTSFAFRDTRASGYQDLLQGEIPYPDNTIPIWLHYMTGIEGPYRGYSPQAPLAEASILATLVKQGKAYAGSGRYMQHTWDQQSMFLKLPDGSFALDSRGWLQWRKERRNTEIMGVSTPLLETDSEIAMRKFYAYFAEAYALNYFRAGSKHLPMSTDRVAGWEQLRFYCQFRLNTEFTGGIPDLPYPEETYNRRPLNPDHTETYGALMYLFFEYLRGWMNTQPRSNLGDNAAIDGKSRGSTEQYEKGFQRAADLNWIHDTPFQFVLPRFPLFEQEYNKNNEYEQFWNKFAIIGGIATYLGKPTVFFIAEWPCQDVDKTTDCYMWVDKGLGPVSPAYLMRLAGREPFVEWWHLPAECAGAEPKDLRFQFNSMKGVKITWTGDYRSAKITNHPTPPVNA